MVTNRKARGRPQGSEIDDSEPMAKIAELLIAHTDMTPRAAMRRLKPRVTDSELRRWQRKWAQRGAECIRLHNEKAAQSRARKYSEQVRPQLGSIIEEVGLVHGKRMLMSAELHRRLEAIPSFRSAMSCFAEAQKAAMALGILPISQISPALALISKYQKGTIGLASPPLVSDLMIKNSIAGINIQRLREAIEAVPHDLLPKHGSKGGTE